MDNAQERQATIVRQVGYRTTTATHSSDPSYCLKRRIGARGLIPII